MVSPRRLFLDHLAPTSDQPLMLDIVEARGVELTDRDGKKYIDLIAGIGVSNVGHGHPAVVAAVREQAEKYMHLMVYGEYIETPQVMLARALTECLPSPLDCVYFVNSGSEAVEGAMKLAKRFTGRPEVAACRNGYYGSTQGALSLMSDGPYKNAFRPLLPGIRLIGFNDEADLEHITRNTACVVTETIQAEAGVILPENGYLKKLRKRCDETGALLISDEVQTGGGRTGTLFAFEHYDMFPDILVLAKSLGGGMPLGAFIARREVMHCLAGNPPLGHMTTFGGHPVSCAAGWAALRVVREMNLRETVAGKEKLFREALTHRAIRRITGKGLMLAVEFAGSDTCRKVIRRCIANGVVTDWFLFADHRMRIAPPLVITDECIRDCARLINKSIDEALQTD